MRNVLGGMLGFSLCCAVCGPSTLAGTPAHPPPSDWPSYGHDDHGSHFSPLTQLTPKNVGELRVAWAYHLRPEGLSKSDASALRPSEATPLVVDGVMYLPSPYGAVLALDADTGNHRWSFTLPAGDRPATRGVAYWPGDAHEPPRIFVGTHSGELFALSATDGKLLSGFGAGGVLDLKTPAVMNGYPHAQYGMSSPPLVFRDLIVTGAQVQEFPSQGASGDVRAWDARTGRLVWTFHTVAQPGEPGHDTWEGASWQHRSGVNVWTSPVADEKRGMVYLPVAAPSFDRWGGDRKGANLYSNSIVALEGATGKYVWHFQTVHHDLWDLDLPVATLIDVRKDGKVIPAIAVANKSSLLFILDRMTGQPLYPVKEVPVPSESDLPGEAPWPTQPMPVTPPPLARQSFSLSDINNLTPQVKGRCEQLVKDWKIVESRMFQPPRADAAVAHLPGGQGGVNWGGGAFDPIQGYYIVNITNLASPAQLGEREPGSWGLAYGYRYFWDSATRMPCQKPPWGEIVAVNVDTGAIAWHKTLGVTDSLPEASRNTGRPNAGGPITTASGLIFVGATDDSRLRAFDSSNGELLWERQLPTSVYATPITYQGRSGRQFVTVVATGGMTHSAVLDDEVIAFALPTTSGAQTEPALGLGLKPESQASSASVRQVLRPPPPGPGLDLVNRHCTSCHPAIQIFSAPPRSRSEWLRTIRLMEGRGGDVAPQEEQAISDYLGQNFGVQNAEENVR